MKGITFEKRLEQVLTDFDECFFNEDDIDFMIYKLGKSSEDDDQLLRTELAFNIFHRLH